MDSENALQVSALLCEYSTLRSENIERHNAIHTEIYVVAAFVAAMIGSCIVASMGKSVFLVFVTMGLATAAILVGVLTISFELKSIRRIGRRLQRIEQKVNHRVGSDVMEWERRWGGVADESLFPTASIPASFPEDEV